MNGGAKLRWGGGGGASRKDPLSLTLLTIPLQKLYQI